MILNLIKKDMGWHLFYFLIFLIPPPVMLDLDGFNDGAVIFIGICILYIVVGSVGLVEIVEDRFHGYQFLRILPVSNIQITAAKFILPFMLGCLCLVYAFILVDKTAPNAAAITLSRAFIVLTVAAALFLVGLIYILRFRYGASSFMKFIFYGAPLLIMVILIAVRVIYKDEFYRADVDSLLVAVSNINWWLLVAAVLIGYVALMLVATAVKKRNMS